MQEVTLYDDQGEPSAVAVSLEDVKKFLLTLDKDLDISIEYQDYDDYGCDHFLTINGACANLVIRKNYGGMYFPANSLECGVELKAIRDNTTFLCAEYGFKHDAPKTVVISDNYTEKLKAFFEHHRCYLSASSEIFSRTESVKFDDPRGDILFGNPNHSMSSITLPDSEFHTGTENKWKPEIRNTQFWTADKPNILSVTEFEKKFDEGSKKINEWEAIDYLISVKRMRWVVDTLLDDELYFVINDENYLDCSTVGGERIDINLGKLKELSKAQIIEYALKAGFDWQIILNIIDDYAINEEDDEKWDWKKYTLNDNSALLVFHGNDNYVQATSNYGYDFY